jgi:hypothetical protein
MVCSILKVNPWMPAIGAKVLRKAAWHARDWGLTKREIKAASNGENKGKKPEGKGGHENEVLAFVLC